jgi:hypothetical protein
LTAPVAPHRAAAQPQPLPPPAPHAVDPDLPARAGVVVAAAAVLTQTVAHLVNGFVFDLDIWNLRADVDANVWAWASSVAMFACAAALLLLAALRPASARLYLFLAAATAFLSADDIGQIHEEIAVVARRLYPGLGEDTSEMIWPVVYLPLLVATVVGLVRVLGRESDAARRVGFVGLPVLGVAVVVDGVWPLFHGDDEAISTPDLLVDALEEGLELGGWILVASALAAVALRAAARPDAGAAR